MVVLQADRRLGAVRIRQIARFVGDRYQTNDGQQLARVLGGPPAVQDAPVTQFLIRDAGKQESIGSGKAIMYILCGAGSDCALPLEASSTAHDRLVRREALELALYTMRYNDVDPIAVLLPPDPQGNPGDAVLFRRDDLEGLLDKPLSQSLPTGKAPNALGMDDLESATVDYLTLTKSYDYDFLSASDGTARMVLNPAARRPVTDPPASRTQNRDNPRANRRRRAVKKGGAWLKSLSTGSARSTQTARARSTASIWRSWTASSWCSSGPRAVARRPRCAWSRDWRRSPKASSDR